MGRQRAPRHANGDHVIPYLRAGNVKDGHLALDSVYGMNFTPTEQAKFGLMPGDVLVTEGCGSLSQIGAAAKWNSEIDGPVGFQNTLLRLRAVEGISDPEFVYQWARWAYETGAFAETASGTSIFHIGARRAAEMSFPDFPIEKQARIADLLEAADRALLEASARRDSIVALRSGFLSAAIDELQGVDHRSVGSLADVQSGLSWSKDDELPSGDPSGIGVMGVSNVQRDHIHADGCTWIRRTRQAEQRSIKGHTILTIRTNGNAERIGNVHLAPVDAIGYTISSFLTAIAPHDPEDSDYMLRVLQSPQMQRAITDATSGSTGLKNIAVTWLRKLEIPWPDTDRRRDIALMAAAFDAVAGAHANEALRLRDLRDAMLNALLRDAHEIPATYDRFLDEHTGRLLAPARV